jgi:hypothetical protein
VHSVAQVSGAQVVANVAVVHELEVDAVAVAGDGIAGDRDAARRPQVDAIAGFGLALSGGAERVVRDAAIRNVREVDAEEAVLDVIVVDQASVRVVDTERGAVFDESWCRRFGA